LSLPDSHAGSAALLFGLVAMVFQTFFVVLTTATTGALVFCIGVDYLAQTGFGELMCAFDLI
jgi:hypothetical protein